MTMMTAMRGKMMMTTIELQELRYGELLKNIYASGTFVKYHCKAWLYNLRFHVVCNECSCSLLQIDVI